MLSASTVASLNEAYSSMYEGQIDEEVLAEELDIIESFVEEIVFELIDEGYDIEEIEESFDDELIEEVIIEAKVTYGSDTESPEERRARAKAKVGEKRSAARKAAVKGAVKAAGEKASAVARKAVDEPARKYAEKRGVVKSKSGKTSLGGGSGIGSVKFKQRTPEGRREVRKAVAKDIKDRAVSKAGEVASKAKAKAAGVAVDATLAGSAAKKKAKETASAAKSAAKGAASSAKGAVKSAASSAKRGLKGLIRRGAEKVARGADRLATRMGEEVETYDVVVEFLCDYGIAEDLQEAQWMMVNEVDSEDIATILEAYGLDEAKGTILSVKSGGKTKYTANRRDLRPDAWNAAVKSSDIRSKERGKNKANTARAEQARKKSIENMNAKPGEDTEDYGNIEPSGDGHYNLKHSNRAARARRASGR